MQRMETIDQEIIRCLEILRDLVPSSTRSGNTNLLQAANLVLQTVAEYHAEKMRLFAETPDPYNYDTPVRSPMRHQEEEDDGGPLQLADLMSMSNTGSPITNDLELDHDWPGEGEEEEDEEETQLPPNITVRAPRRPACGRKTVYVLIPDQLETAAEQMCNICYETPLLKDACTTGCNHVFCKSCFIRWETSCQGDPTCPSCRNVRPLVTEYKPYQGF
jgi:Ring finger domain